MLFCQHPAAPHKEVTDGCKYCIEGAMAYAKRIDAAREEWVREARNAALEEAARVVESAMHDDCGESVTPCNGCCALGQLAGDIRMKKSTNS